MSRDSYIVPEGLPFIGLALLVTILFLLIGYPWPALLFGGVTLFVIFFFRNPQRDIPTDRSAVVSPADGKIIKIEDVVLQNDVIMGPFKMISIFMNVFNVHVNRIPYGGVVSAIQYNRGKYIRANLEGASFINERNKVVLRTEGGRELMVVQVAGLIARRIACWTEVGKKVKTGERFGLIRFGSRLDVYLPAEAGIRVKLGDKVRAGETILGELL